MGFGAYMKITNDRSSAVRTFVTDVHCTYQDDDRSGSRLASFNNRRIDANSTYPASGHTYVEAKNSGLCFFHSASFRIKVTDDANNVTIGTVSFEDSFGAWKLSSNTNDDVLDVDIDNSGEQGTIVITVASF